MLHLWIGENNWPRETVSGAVLERVASWQQCLFSSLFTGEPNACSRELSIRMASGRTRARRPLGASSCQPAGQAAPVGSAGARFMQFEAQETDSDHLFFGPLSLVGGTHNSVWRGSGGTQTVHMLLPSWAHLQTVCSAHCAHSHTAHLTLCVRLASVQQLCERRANCPAQKSCSARAQQSAALAKQQLCAAAHFPASGQSPAA